MNFRLLTASLAASLALFPGASLANTVAGVGSQSSTNNQSNSGSVVLNPSGGTQVNNNVNNAFSSTYSFGPGISCPTPSLAFSSYGGSSNANSSGYNSGSSAYGASASFIIPLGGDIGSARRKLVKEIAHQRVLDTQVNMINVCAQFARQGVKIDTVKFPEFEACSGVQVAGNHAVNVEPERVFSPANTAIPVIPVGKQ